MSSSSFPTTITNTTNTVTTASGTGSATASGSYYQHPQQHQQPSTSTSASRLLGSSGAAGGHQVSGTSGYTHSGLHTHSYGSGATSATSGSNIYSYPPSNVPSGPSSNLLAPPSGAGQTTTAETSTSASAGANGDGNGATTGASSSFYNHHYQQPSGHSFLSDVNEVKDMENSLLTLLASFHAGDLSAFGKGCSLQTMETIRAKQERLAKLHFELGSSKAGNTGTTDSSTTQNWMSDDDQNKLVAELRELSLEIEKLHETSS